MTRAGEREIVKAEHANGGAGYILKEALLTGEDLGQHCRMFSRVTIPAGCELGYHEHHGESETYYILSGEGEYDDNGTKRIVKAGDVTHTPDGCGHALANTGDTDLVFMALIILG